VAKNPAVDLIHVMNLSSYFHYHRNMKNTEAIQAFLALGQESRLNVYRLIVQKGDQGLMPSQIHEMLGIPNATLSFHLKELYLAGLITVERQSRNLIYRPNAQLVQNLSEFLLDNCCGGQSCAPLKPSKKAKLS
jgi:ArsR family transcriptional regulator, arsenate/arsenite/antimonite-responsive transcriptional repressor